MQELTIVMCAAMCPMSELGDIMFFAESRAEFLAKKFCITKIPSKSTMNRILSLVDGRQFVQPAMTENRTRYCKELMRI